MLRVVLVLSSIAYAWSLRLPSRAASFRPRNLQLSSHYIWSYKTRPEDFIVIEDRALEFFGAEDTTLLDAAKKEESKLSVEDLQSFLSAKLRSEQEIDLQQLSLKTFEGHSGVDGLTLAITPPLSKLERTQFHEGIRSIYPMLDSKTEVVKVVNNADAEPPIFTYIQVYPKGAKSIATAAGSNAPSAKGGNDAMASSQSDAIVVDGGRQSSTASDATDAEATTDTTAVVTDDDSGTGSDESTGTSDTGTTESTGKGKEKGKGKRGKGKKKVVVQRWDRSKPDYQHFTVVKRMISTPEMIDKLARYTTMLPSRFEYCGSKDSRAITLQRLSAWRLAPGTLEKINSCSESQLLSVRDIVPAKKPMNLGDLSGNFFAITLRKNANKSADNRVLAEHGAAAVAVVFDEPQHNSIDTAIDLEMPQLLHGIKALAGQPFVNIFGPQRFGSPLPVNPLIGQRLLRGDYRAAVFMLLIAPTSKLELTLGGLSLHRLSTEWFASNNDDRNRDHNDDDNVNNGADSRAQDEVKERIVNSANDISHLTRLSLLWAEYESNLRSAVELQLQVLSSTVGADSVMSSVSGRSDKAINSGSDRSDKAVNSGSDRSDKAINVIDSRRPSSTFVGGRDDEEVSLVSESLAGHDDSNDEKLLSPGDDGTGDNTAGSSTSSSNSNKNVVSGGVRSMTRKELKTQYFLLNNIEAKITSISALLAGREFQVPRNALFVQKQLLKKLAEEIQAAAARDTSNANLPILHHGGGAAADVLDKIDFRKVFSVLPKSLRQLFVNSYQSLIWNEEAQARMNPPPPPEPDNHTPPPTTITTANHDRGSSNSRSNPSSITSSNSDKLQYAQEGDMVLVDVHTKQPLTAWDVAAENISLSANHIPVWSSSSSSASSSVGDGSVLPDVAEPTTASSTSSSLRPTGNEESGNSGENSSSNMINSSSAKKKNEGKGSKEEEHAAATSPIIAFSQARYHIVTLEEAASHAYPIDAVILPLPGTVTHLPARMQQRLAKEDGMTVLLDGSHRDWIFRMPGAYRHIVSTARNVRFAPLASSSSSASILLDKNKVDENKPSLSIQWESCHTLSSQPLVLPSLASSAAGGPIDISQSDHGRAGSVSPFSSRVDQLWDSGVLPDFLDGIYRYPSGGSLVPVPIPVSVGEHSSTVEALGSEVQGVSSTAGAGTAGQMQEETVATKVAATLPLPPITTAIASYIVPKDFSATAVSSSTTTTTTTSRPAAGTSNDSSGGEKALGGGVSDVSVNAVGEDGLRICFSLCASTYATSYLDWLFSRISYDSFIHQQQKGGRNE